MILTTCSVYDIKMISQLKRMLRTNVISRDLSFRWVSDRYPISQHRSHYNDAIMDPTYTMSSHVSHLVQVAFLKLRDLSYFRRYLTDESTKKGGSCIYNLPIGLLQQSTVRSPPRTDNENAKGYNCCSSTCHKNQEVWSHHSCFAWLTLAACVLQMSIQNFTDCF